MDLFTAQEMEAIEAVKLQLSVAEQDMERAARHQFEIWGAKLKQIRDNDWYIAFEPGCTWEQYVESRWEISRRRADQIINAFETVELMRTIVPESGTIVPLPARETHVRPLAQLESPEHKAEVWQRVVASANGKTITASMVKDEVSRYKAALEKNWITLEEWAAGERWHGASTTKPMNKVNENIEWAMWSWNPITGCLHNCAYCYARDIANRFYPYGFQPAFKPDRLDAPKNTRTPAPRWVGDIGYKGVFVCSMADLFGKWVPDEWIDAVLKSIRENPQWTFLLLTKFPIKMAEYSYPPNVWLGTTVDRQWAVERAEKGFTKIKASGFDGVCWLSCEPMMERLTFSSLEMFDWLVMGGASRSSQTPEYKPPFDDIVHLHNQARGADIPIYQKTNLIPGMSDDQRLREYPNAITTND